MGLSTELISEFVKITNDNKKSKEDNTVYGTVKTVSADGKSGTVEIDGSNEATPVSTTCTISVGDRVRLNIRSHNAIVTGNVSDQSIGVKRAGAMESLINQTADNIRLEVSNKVDNLTSSLDITAEGIRSEVSASLAKVNANIGGLDTRITNAESSIDQTASKITSTVAAEFVSVNNQLRNIGTEVQDLSGRITNAESRISQTATEITTEVRAYYDTVNGKVDNFSEFKQTVEGFSFMGKGGTVKISGGDITLTGAIKFSDLSDATTKQAEIDAAKSTADSASSAASDAYDRADSAYDKADDALDTVSGWAHSKDGTYIDGEMIYSDSIYASSIHLGGWLTVYKTKKGSTIGGYIGYDRGFNSTYGIGMQAYDSDAQCVCSDEAARLSWGTDAQFVASESGYAYVDGSVIIFEIDGTSYVALTDHGTYGSLRPHTDAPTMHLGNSSYRWGGVYATNGEIQTSDRNLKNNIETLPDKYITLFDNIIPRRFKMNEGSSGRYHVGYIAQEVEEAMFKAGIDSLEFGGFVRDVDADGNEICMLRYGEFDGIYAAKIKQLEARVAALEER